MGIIKKITLVALLIVVGYGIFNVVSMYENSPFRPESDSNVPQNDVLTSFTEQERQKLKEQYPDGIQVGKIENNP